MEIIDAQVHIHEPDSAGRPWIPGYGSVGDYALKRRGQEIYAVSDEHLVNMMVAAGVDGAVLVQAPMYGWDNSYIFGAAVMRPEKFRAVGLIDRDRADLDAELRTWRANPAVVGVRIAIQTAEERECLESGGYEAVISAADRNEMPLFVYAPEALHSVGDIARRHPSLLIIVDHLGLRQGVLSKPSPESFDGVGATVELAQFENVAVKCSGLPSLSMQEYPFSDIWPHLHRVINAFGTARVMWGADISRVIWGQARPNAKYHTYAEAVMYITQSSELSESEKSAVMGGTLRELLGWKPLGTGLRRL
jgi:L-fuconolactonase